MVQFKKKRSCREIYFTSERFFFFSGSISKASQYRAAQLHTAGIITLLGLKTAMQWCNVGRMPILRGGHQANLPILTTSPLIHLTFDIIYGIILG